MRSRRSVRTLALLAGLSLPCATWAQGVPAGDAAAKDAGDSKKESLAAKRTDHLARTIARLATFNLRTISNPTSDDQRVASILLSMACDLVPEDEDMLRRRIEAAYNAGDEAGVLDLSRKLLKMDPNDTVTQLRLISASIGRQNQTVESRLDAYKRFIDEKRLDDSVRSRLALDAALLMREQGNEQGFKDNLEKALKLDPTNKEAAYTLVVYLDDRTTNPVNRLDLYGYLLMADPIDPKTHLAIANLLACNGAFKAAKRFHDNATLILSKSGESFPQAGIEQVVLLWQTDGPAAAVASLTQALNQNRKNAIDEIQRRKDRKLPLDDAKKPEDVRLPDDFMELMLYAALAADDKVAVASTSKAIMDSLTGSIDALQDPLRRGQIDEAKANDVVQTATLAMHTIRVVANLDLKDTIKSLETDAALEKKAPHEVDIMRSWVQLRQAKYDEAIEGFRPYVNENPMAAFGSAYAQELAGRKSEAIAAYTALAQKRPLDPLSAWARTRSRALGDTQEPAIARELESKASAIPSDYDRMPQSPRDFLMVRAELSEEGPESTDRLWVTITIQNLSRFTLSYGPNRAIDSEFLLAPSIENRSDALEKLVRPEVADLARRLRLAPREKVQYKVWADPGQTGWVIEGLANRSVRLRWLAIQDFVTESGGGYHPGVFALSSETGATVRKPPAECSFDAAALKARLLEDSPDTLPRIAVAIRSLVLRPLLIAPKAAAPDATAAGALKIGDAEGPKNEVETTPEMLKPLADAISARYPQLDALTRAHLVAILPSARLAPGMEAFDTLVKSETDPLVLSLVLVTRVTSPDDPILAAAEQHSDERVRALAAALRPGLSREEVTAARLTPEDVRKMRDIDPRMTPMMSDAAAKATKPLKMQGAAGQSEKPAPDVNK